MDFDLLMAPIIIFMIFVAPIWLILHYRSKRQVNQGLTADEYETIKDLAARAEQMSDRINTLEAILDAESPEWRSKI
ncbi:envelope stress response membrane protein PspB [Neptunicella sp. SCSIO 80796]|uniref:envelope stress response membrane protein PspB n=1 Tax=Neptunicella plasticusilytica TaxID=3117012 RepID=UPI003A4E27D8